MIVLFLLGSLAACGFGLCVGVKLAYAQMERVD